MVRYACKNNREQASGTRRRGRGEAAEAMVGAALGTSAKRAELLFMWVAQLFMFFLVLIRRFFRTMVEDRDSSLHGDMSMAATRRQPERITKARSSEDEGLDSLEEEKEPVFRFRFSFQTPETRLGGREAHEGEGAAPSTAARIGSYKLISAGRDITAFQEVPRAMMTICVENRDVRGRTAATATPLEERSSESKTSPDAADSVAGAAIRGDPDVPAASYSGGDLPDNTETSVGERSSGSFGGVPRETEEAEKVDEGPDGLDSDREDAEIATDWELKSFDGDESADHGPEREKDDLFSSNSGGSSHMSDRCVFDYGADNERSDEDMNSSVGYSSLRYGGGGGGVLPDVEADVHSGHRDSDNIHGEDPDEEGRRRENRPQPEVYHRTRADGRRSEETSHHGEPEEAAASDQLESLWEHQDLVEQLRMERRRVRSAGMLSSIAPEETESPELVTEHLMLLKFDTKFLQEDLPMDELHRCYKCYRERMRKFDILSYQKMYAVGFLRREGHPRPAGTTRRLPPFPSPFLLLLLLFDQNLLRPRRRKSSGVDRSEELLRELRGDLETVYVGQSCLSWEFLRWQYGRVRELLESDGHRDGRRRYTGAAGELQQFRVLIDRFLEDEPFRGPRVECYVNSRCVRRRLLQVPIIREDGVPDEHGGLTSEQLDCAMKNSIRAFWNFIKADKDAAPYAVKEAISEDRELAEVIQAELRKLGKKLKGIMRARRCPARRFKKPRNGRCSQDDILLCRIDLEMVGRVLAMRKITSDQLAWCHAKLSKITAVDRELPRDSSFLPFPC